MFGFDKLIGYIVALLSIVGGVFAYGKSKEAKGAAKVEQKATQELVNDLEIKEEIKEATRESIETDSDIDIVNRM